MNCCQLCHNPINNDSHKKPEDGNKCLPLFELHCHEVQWRRDHLRVEDPRWSPDFCEQTLQLQVQLALAFHQECVRNRINDWRAAFGNSGDRDGDHYYDRSFQFLYEDVWWELEDNDAPPDIVNGLEDLALTKVGYDLLRGGFWLRLQCDCFVADWIGTETKKLVQSALNVFLRAAPGKRDCEIGSTLMR